MSIFRITWSQGHTRDIEADSMNDAIKTAGYFFKIEELKIPAGCMRIKDLEDIYGSLRDKLIKTGDREYTGVFATVVPFIFGRWWIIRMCM